MPEIPKFQSDRFKLIAAFLVVSIISLVQPGCNCSSSGFDTPQSAVTSVSPISYSDTALVTSDISVLFTGEMDSTSVESAFTLTKNSSPVSVNYDASVSYDAKMFSWSPVDDLEPNTAYFATIASSVKDINGNTPLTADYVWSFTTAPAMQLVSKDADGVTADNTSKTADIDATGRYIVFESKATNLITDITIPPNGPSQVYRKDTVTGQIMLVSSNSSGLEAANNNAKNPAISADGRFVVFESNATNLDADITVSANGPTQVYRKNIISGEVILVSRDSTGQAAANNDASNPAISANGRYIVFESNATDLVDAPVSSASQVYRKDMGDESVKMISRTVEIISGITVDVAGDAASSNPDISADGSHIVFQSLARNFSATNGLSHIYYVNANATSHSVELISVATSGVPSVADNYRPSVSDDGLTVVFDTVADNLDGLIVDNNGSTDIYLRYRGTIPDTSLVSTSATTTNSGNGASTNAQISGNADYVVFESLASDLATGSTSGVKDILVRDLSDTGIVIEKLDNPTTSFDSNGPAISSDGRYITFDSSAPYTTDDGDTLSDIYRAHNTTTLP